MIFRKMTMPQLLLFITALLAQTSRAQIQEPCYVCRRSDRRVINRDFSFELTDLLGNVNSWTCGELEDAGIESVLVSNTVCGVFIAHADRHCECGGPPIQPPTVIDTSPACDICKGNGFVPEIMWDELVDTGFAGEFPCGFLYESAADGFLAGSYCSPLQANVGPTCCNIPQLECIPGLTCPDDNNGGGGGGQPVVEEPVCSDLHQVCDMDATEGPSSCCGRFVCKRRTLGSDATCAVPAIRQRQSVASGNRGGAAGVAKYSN